MTCSISHYKVKVYRYNQMLLLNLFKGFGRLVEKVFCEKVSFRNIFLLLFFSLQNLHTAVFFLIASQIL